MTNKDMALFWLQALKNGTMAYEDAVLKIRQYLKASGLTLADVGASEAILDDGFKRGCTMMAEICLERLKSTPSMQKTYERSLQFYIDQGKLDSSMFTASTSPTRSGTSTYDPGFVDAR